MGLGDQVVVDFADYVAAAQASAASLLAVTAPAQLSQQGSGDE